MLKILALVVLLLGSCGTEREVTPKEEQPSGPAPGGGDVAVKFADIQPLLKTYCSKCHASSQFLVSEAAWRSSPASGRVARLEMPVPSSQEARTLSAADRAKIVSFK